MTTEGMRKLVEVTARRGQVAVAAIAVVIVAHVVDLLWFGSSRDDGGGLASLLVGAPTRADVRVFLMAFAGISIALAVLYFRWLYSAAKSAHALALDRGVVTGSALFVAYMIPLMNLVRPRRHMQGIVAASDPKKIRVTPELRERAAVGYRDAAAERVSDASYRPPFISVDGWWFAWIVGGFVGSLSRFSGLGRSGEAVEYALLITALVLLIGIVRGVTTMQREKVRRIEARRRAKREAA